MKSPLRKTKQVSRQQGACLPASVAVTASALQKQHQQKRTSPARTATAQPAPGATEPHAGHRPRWADCTHNRAGQAGLTGDSHAAATAPRHGCTCPSAVKDVAVQTGRSQGRRPQGVLGSRPDKHVCAARRCVPRHGHHERHHRSPPVAHPLRGGRSHGNSTEPPTAWPTGHPLGHHRSPAPLPRHPKPQPLTGVTTAHHPKGNSNDSHPALTPGGCPEPQGRSAPSHVPVTRGPKCKFSPFSLVPAFQANLCARQGLPLLQTHSWTCVPRGWDPAQMHTGPGNRGRPSWLPEALVDLQGPCAVTGHERR